LLNKNINWEKHMASLHHPSGNSAGELRLEMPIRLDFSAARAIIDDIRKISAQRMPDRLSLDFGRTTHIDTAGIGCLLVIAEHFGANAVIRIERASGMVRKLLDMAHIGHIGNADGTTARRSDLRLCSACKKPANEECGASLHDAHACPRVRQATSHGDRTARQAHFQFA
jgi:anti-anti-sigma regulatory factor